MSTFLYAVFIGAGSLMLIGSVGISIYTICSEVRYMIRKSKGGAE
tara:strand:+ start:2156 stop:2290 length:135 start_codon:yes stop_codon:yes gene_type:complete